MKCWEMDPLRRCTAKELVDELDELSADEKVLSF